jgi:hypothetical protein
MAEEKEQLKTIEEVPESFTSNDNDISVGDTPIVKNESNSTNSQDLNYLNPEIFDSFFTIGVSPTLMSLSFDVNDSGTSSIVFNCSFSSAILWYCLFYFIFICAINLFCFILFRIKMVFYKNFINFLFLFKIMGGVLNKVVVAVPHQYSFIVERFGKFEKVLKPGLNFLLPLVQNVSY